ncbi:MAG: hypothetical protein JWN44_7013 [Myxococcales bacterium]|nr:hypothetical protein [Myxococcales bacterium]
MWKSIVLCVSLFGGAALGLALGARFVEPAALPAAAALGLCVIGVVLILSAPQAEATMEEADDAQILSSATGSMATIDPIELPVIPVPSVANRTPSIPFEALNT